MCALGLEGGCKVFAGVFIHQEISRFVLNVKKVVLVGINFKLCYRSIKFLVMVPVKNLLN